MNTTANRRLTGLVGLLLSLLVFAISVRAASAAPGEGRGSIDTAVVTLAEQTAPAELGRGGVDFALGALGATPTSSGSSSTAAWIIGAAAAVLIVVIAGSTLFRRRRLQAAPPLLRPCR